MLPQLWVTCRGGVGKSTLFIALTSKMEETQNSSLICFSHKWCYVDAWARTYFRGRWARVLGRGRLVGDNGHGRRARTYWRWIWARPICRWARTQGTNVLAGTIGTDARRKRTTSKLIFFILFFETNGKTIVLKNERNKSQALGLDREREEKPKNHKWHE